MSKEKRPRRPVPKPKVQVQTVTLSASELKATVKSEEGVEEIMAAPEMKPYMDLARAWVSHSDVRPALAAIQAAPLEKRYVWRIASALKWGFADFDDLSVRADRDTLARADFARLMELLGKAPHSALLPVRHAGGQAPHGEDHAVCHRSHQAGQ